MYQCIICDPDARNAEAISPGLFYTAVSRATTLGDADGLNSAIYFTGEHLTKARIQQLTKKKHHDEEYIKVTRRKKWVQHLHANTYTPKQLPAKAKKNLLKWSKRKFTYEQLYKRTNKYVKEKK